MMYTLALTIDGPPGKELLEKALGLLADQNADWYMQQWARGKEPPISARAAGVRWRPDEPSDYAEFTSAPVMLSLGAASCGPIAAFKVGYYRAIEILSGRTNMAARQRHKVALIETGDHYWHAYHRSPWGLFDPTKGMIR